MWRSMLLITACACTRIELPDAPPAAPTPDPETPEPAMPRGFDAGTFSGALVSDAPASPCLIVEDLDGDHRTDLAWVDTRTWRLELRWGAPSSPRATHPSAGVDVPALGSYVACVAEDLDDDGVVDLGVASQSTLAIVRFAEGRALSVETSHLPAPSALPHSDPDRLTVLTTTDANGDGATDLVLAIAGMGQNECTRPGQREERADPTKGPYVPAFGYCLLADGAGGFRVDDEGRCPVQMFHDQPAYPFGAASTDIDGDSLRDLVFVHDFGGNDILRGTGERFEHHPSSGLDVYNHAMGLALADFNGDGSVDAYTTDLPGHQLYLGAPDGVWFASATATGVRPATSAAVSWGVVARDLDANGTTDALSLSSMEVTAELAAGPACDLYTLDVPFPPAILLDNAGQTFTRRDVLIPGATRGSFRPITAASGDLDADGRPDVVVAHPEGVSVLYNDIPPVHPSLRVRPLDEAGRPARGARVEAVLADGSRRLWVADPGSATSGHNELIGYLAVPEGGLPVDVHVTWPDGGRSVFEDITDLTSVIPLDHP